MEMKGSKSKHRRCSEGGGTRTNRRESSCEEEKREESKVSSSSHVDSTKARRNHDSRSNHDTLGLQPLDVLGLLKEGVDLKRGKAEVSFAFRRRSRAKERLTSSWIASGTCLAVLRISSTSDWIMLEIPMFRTLPVAVGRRTRPWVSKDASRSRPTRRRAHRGDPP